MNNHNNPKLPIFKGTILFYLDNLSDILKMLLPLDNKNYTIEDLRRVEDGISENYYKGVKK